MQKADLPLYNRAQPFIGIRPVARDPRPELRHQAGMIERLWLSRAQVCFGAAEPEDIAVKDHFLMAKRLAVIFHQAFFRERE